MKKFINAALKLLIILTVGGVIAGIADHNRNKNSKHKPKGLYEAYFKRPMDFVCGMLAITVFWPFYLIIAILVKVKLGSPVLFVQDRPGQNEKIFKLYKFRSMTNERDEKGELLPDEDRMTPFGSWLRQSSMDELPEAVNIIRGDMSLVGPRPLLIRYLNRYNEEQRHRHDVKPGLSGYAQVHGRNLMSWEERFAMDVEYANNITFLGDMRILWDTVLKAVIRKEGIHSTTSVTMEEFMGNEGKDTAEMPGGGA